jgi:hydantoinase/carbamoylase family amidase
MLQIAPMTLSDLKIDADRLRADFDELSRIGGTPQGGVNRLALSPEDLRARVWFGNKVDEAGLLLRDDDAANVSGVLLCPNPHARTLMLGSHLDTVPNGGRFDGALGVVAGLEVLRTIHESGVVLPVNLEVIDFTDDEGCWKSLFGVRVMGGMFGQRDVDSIIARDTTFEAALRRAGVEPRSLLKARRDPATMAGYLELHIEQGQRLEREGLHIGVVSGIVGRKRYEVIFYGQAGHSGTTDMYKRRDALRGAAQFIVRAHDLVRERFGDGIFNCGDVDVKPGQFNIIPSEARLTVEIRHVDERLMADMEMAVFSIARECAASFGLEVSLDTVTHMPAATMSDGLMEMVEQVCDDLGLSHKRLVSYSGHSAQILSSIIPCAMVFIPSIGGISHHPKENSHWEDVVNGANVLLRSVLAAALRLA